MDTDAATQLHHKPMRSSLARSKPSLGRGEMRGPSVPSCCACDCHLRGCQASNIGYPATGRPINLIPPPPPPPNPYPNWAPLLPSIMSNQTAAPFQQQAGGVPKAFATPPPTRAKASRLADSQPTIPKPSFLPSVTNQASSPIQQPSSPMTFSPQAPRIKTSTSADSPPAPPASNPTTTPTTNSCFEMPDDVEIIIESGGDSR